jgi:hypothetical protein
MKKQELGTYVKRLGFFFILIGVFIFIGMGPKGYKGSFGAAWFVAVPLVILGVFCIYTGSNWENIIDD